MQAIEKNYKIINYLLFQICWVFCIMGTDIMAVCATAFFLISHLYITGSGAKELRNILLVATAGFSMDVLCAYIGLINLSPGGTFPLYLFCVWVIFASTINWSFKFVMERMDLAILTGFFSPLAYYAAHKLEKVQYIESLVQSMLLHALLWSLFMLIVHSYFNCMKISQSDA